MVRRRLLTGYLVFSVALLASIGGCFAIPSQGSSLGSFHGGFHQVNLTLRERASLTVELSFRTADYDSGLLFLAVQSNHSGYLAAGLRDSALEIVLKRDGQSPQTLLSFDFTLHNTSLSPSDWHSLSLQYHQSQLSVSVHTTNIHSQTLTLDEAFSDVFFAGMDSFLSHNLFHTLALANYFIGCLANVSVNSEPVDFVPDPQNGVGVECCLIPRTPSWCFQSTYSNLSIPIPATLHHDGSILISFHIQVSADGLVLFTQTDSSQSLHLYLTGHNLSLIISTPQEGSTEMLNCPPLPTRREWHLVEITLTSGSISCAVGNTASNMQLSTVLALSFTSLILGSADMQDVHHPSFEGCIEHFELNSAEIRPSLGSQLTEYSEPLQWEELTFDLHPLTVDEGDRVRLSELNIILKFPEDFFTNDLAFLYQQDIERAIQVRSLEGPYQGSFVCGKSGNAVSLFTYNALTSQDNETQIFYQNSVISENITDEAVIELSVECGGKRQVLFNGTLEITVIDVIASPLMLTQNNAISIAAGTRRVITPNHLTVISRVTPNPRFISFAFQSIEPLGACEDSLCDEERGKLVKTHNPNLPAMFFSQEEVNDGNISFQHYEKFGTEPVVIKLQASTNGGGSINITIDVYPYQGRIDDLTPPLTCLFVREGSLALVEPEQLNTTTNFEDQDPIVSYDLIEEPKYGYFERFIAYHNIFPDWHPLTSITPSTGGNQILNINYFTQQDINNGHVRYVHNHSSVLTLESEMSKFRLRSANLTGDNKTLCITIVAELTLIQPTISISAQLIRVNESKSVQINRDLLTTTASRTEDYIHGAVDIEEMGIMYILESVPSYGHLVVDHMELGVGDNFTLDNVSSGLLSYEHRGTEDHNDSFKVFAVAMTTGTQLFLTPDRSLVVTVNISITPVNDHKPVLSTSRVPINPPEGGFIGITEQHILVTDQDRPHEVLTIFIRKKGDPPIGYFAFADSSDTSITRFTMEDVSERRVIYKHWLNTSAPLAHTQLVRLDDGNKSHYVREPIEIRAEPLNLTVEISEPDESDCLASIDASLQQLAVTIDYTVFGIMLEDHLGQDGNLVPEIIVTISSPPLYGQFNNRVRMERNITAFTVAELELAEIEYRFTKQSTTTFRDDFSLMFQYGSSSVGPFPLQICIIPVPIPEIVYSGSASVAFGGMVNLDSTHLLASDNRGGMNNSLVYRILVPPQNGSIINGQVDNMMNADITNFTQTDLNNQRVVYKSRHLDTSGTMQQDSFTFQVCIKHMCTEPKIFVIHINRKNITVINTGFEVPEGSEHLITISELNLFAPQGSTLLRFFVKWPPKHGNITFKTEFTEIVAVHFFGLADIEARYILYRNDGSENLHDSFEITATANYRNEATGTLETLQFSDMVNITIRPVNDNPPEIVRPLDEFDAVRDGSTNIPGLLLSAHDYDSDMRDEDIVWEITFGSPIHGYMYLDEDPGEEYAISSWTEGDLSNNRLFYRNKGGNRDILFYTITDGVHKSVAYETFLNLQSIIFESNATASGPLTVVEGENAAITTDYLSYFASNDDSLRDEDFTYTIKSLPMHGSLMFNGVTLQTESSFNQQSLHNGSLVYIHDHSNSKRDHFQYELSVGDRAKSSFEFTIVVNSVDDDPPVVTFIQDPLFVVELKHVQINGSALVIEDLDSEIDVEFDDIVCTVVTPPRYGLLPRSRFGIETRSTSVFTKYDVERSQLRYNHTSLDHYEDSFMFKVTDGINSQNETYQVRIIILPNQIAMQVNNISVEEGLQVKMEREDFIIDHPYLSNAPGQFIVIRGPSSGELRNVLADEKITSAFTIHDLANGSIVYQHNGKEIVSDSFDFLYESLQPEGLHRRSAPKTVHITIKPVDDEPPIFMRQAVKADIISGSEILLNETYLNVSDGDTPFEHLNYTFILNINGHIAYTNDTEQSIIWFTQADVLAGRVKFFHEMDVIGTIEFNVTDGKQYALATLTITATELHINCDQNKWSEISVKAGGEVMIINDHIDCRIFHTEEVPITFVVNQPRHGYISVDGEVRNSFMMEEINDNKVVYVHNDFDFWEEEEHLLVNATATYVEPFPFEKVIRIHYPSSNTSLFAVNEGLQLSEGDKACLDVSNLDVRNLRYLAWIGMQRVNSQLASSPRDLVPVFNVTHLPSNLPSNGDLLLNSTIVSSTPASFTYSDVLHEGVCYQHSGNEKFEDYIHLQLYFVLQTNLVSPLVFSGNQSYLNIVNESIAIKITPVNDERPQLKASRDLSLVLNFTVNITADELCARDLDSLPDKVTFILLAPPTNARLYLSGKELSVGMNFTQADIDNHRLKIEPVLITTERDQFTLSYRDEVEPLMEKQVTINFTVSQHYLEIVDPKEVTYQQNRTQVIITTDYLNTKTNGIRRETIFEVKSHPMIGQIQVVGKSQDRFTQIDVDEGRVKYIPPKSDTSTYWDEATLQVTNHNQSKSVTLKFTSLAWGTVREETTINLTSSNLSQPLPKDLLVLGPGKPPKIHVIQEPTYGRLEFRVDGEAADLIGDRSFHYDDLVDRGWVHYTWDYTQPVFSDELVDNFTLLVVVQGMQPGMAAISLKVLPPESYPLTPTTLPPGNNNGGRTDSPKQPSSGENTGNDDNGFPIYTLVPILGTFGILLIIIVVIVVFCVTQQKRIRKKWQPGVARSRPPVQRTYPWSVDSHIPGSRTMAPPNYNFDPTSQSDESDNEEHNSETSSGFSEPAVVSPRHSPIQQAFSISAHSQQHSQPGSSHAAYGTPSLAPPRARSRARSNVSITFSSRQSMVSDVSIEDSSHFYSHSLPRPQQHGVIVPTPMRPASHSAFSRVPRHIPPMESGYNSGMFRSAEDSGVPSRAGSCIGEYDDDCELPPFPSADVDVPLPSSLNDRLSGSIVVPSLSCPTADAGPGPMELKSSLAIGEDFLDLNDPNVLQRLRSPNPVLRKEEYWV